MSKRQVKVGELLDLLEQHYAANKLRSLAEVRLIVRNNLRPWFGECSAILIKKSHVEEYKLDRQRAGAANGTVNRELARLRKAFNLGIEEGIIDSRPAIKTLEEADPRTGFWTYDELRKFETTARTKGREKNWDGDIIADIYLFSFFSGWRLSEVVTLNRTYVDTELRIVVLPRSKHKNKRAKIYPLEGELWAMIERRLQDPAPDGSLFHRSGRPVRSIYKLAATVCSEVGIGKSFHDLRRSATTNLNRSGVIKETGKRITGHQNDALYHQYNQVELDDLRDAVKKVNAHLGVGQENEDLTQNSVHANLSDSRATTTMKNEHDYRAPTIESWRRGRDSNPRESVRLNTISSHIADPKPASTISFFSSFFKGLVKKIKGGAL